MEVILIKITLIYNSFYCCIGLLLFFFSFVSALYVLIWQQKKEFFMNLVKNNFFLIINKGKLKLYIGRVRLAYIWIRLNIIFQSILLSKCIIKFFLIIQTVDWKEVNILLMSYTGETAVNSICIGIMIYGIYKIVKVTIKEYGYASELKSAQENLNDVVEKHGEIGHEIISQVQKCNNIKHEIELCDWLLKEDLTTVICAGFIALLIKHYNTAGPGAGPGAGLGGDDFNG